jgi:hypothetical protein
MVSMTVLNNDEHKVAASEDQTPKPKPKRKRIMARVVCDLCFLEVNKKHLKTHQDSQKCKLRKVEMELARLSQQQQHAQQTQQTHPPVLRPIALRISPAPQVAETPQEEEPQQQMLVSFTSNPNPNSHDKPFFKPRQTRVRPAVPSVSKLGAMQDLQEWLLTVKSVSEATAKAAVGALRKILAKKYGDSRVITKQELYFGVIDVVNFQQFMAQMEAAGMKAASRKHYAEAIRQALQYVETRPRGDAPDAEEEDDGTPIVVPTQEAIAAMRATVEVNKKGLSRRARSQQKHLSHRELMATGQMLTEQDLPRLLKESAAHFTRLVDACERRFAMIEDAMEAQQALVTVMALGTGVAVRGGDFCNLTVEHVNEAQKHKTMTIDNHKTSAIHGPLVIPVPDWLYWMLNRFVTLFRPQLVQSERPTNNLFLTRRGRIMKNMTTLVLTPYVKQLTGKHITFTNVRKFMETVSFNSFDAATQKLISQGQCHNDATAESNYKLRQQDLAAKASNKAFNQVMGMDKAVTEVLKAHVVEDDSSTVVDDEAEEEEKLIVVEDDDCMNDNTPSIKGNEQNQTPNKQQDNSMPIVVEEECKDDVAQSLVAMLPDPPSDSETGPSTPKPKPKPKIVVDPSFRRAHGLGVTWSNVETRALLEAVANWEKNNASANTIAWTFILGDSNRKELKDKSASMCKDKMRALKAADKAIFDYIRDKIEVPPEARREYDRSARKGRTASHAKLTSPMETKKRKIA